MEYGMPTLLELGSIEENAVLAKSLGLSFVELNMNLPEYQAEELIGEDRFLKMEERYGIYYTIHLEETFAICDYNQEVERAYRTTMKRTIAAAKRLQAPVINMHMNKGISFMLPDGKVYLHKQYIGKYKESIRSFIAMCRQEIAGSGIRIAIENTDGYLDFERWAIEEMLKEEEFMLTWDIGHSYAAKEADRPFLLSNRERILHFHIHDGIGNGIHQTLGTGEIQIEQYIALARSQDARCVIETKTKDALCKSVEWMRKQKLFCKQ